MTEQIVARLDEFVAIQRELESILQTLVLNDSTIIDALAQMLGAMQQMQARSEKVQAGLSESHTLLASEVRGLALAVTRLDDERRLPPVVLSSDGYAKSDPEVALLQYLQPFLEDAIALDVGANVGDVSARLLDAGYRVFAFEPYEPTFRRLSDRLRGRERLRAFQLAVGASDGERQLHVAADFSGNGSVDSSLYHTLVAHPTGEHIRLTGTVPVQVRSLESLRRAREIPDRIGVLKIDTEGGDVEVLQGAGELDVSVIVAEFWDAAHEFGKAGHGSLERTVSAVMGKGFFWYIVIYRPDDGGGISYYLNRPTTVPKSWGNAVFFRDHGLFAKALRWCEAALSPTFFR